jgi:hypothetical protein
MSEWLMREGGRGGAGALELTTIRTFVRPYSRMDSHVSIQSALQGEPDVTFRTIVWFLSRMYAPVFSESPSRWKRFGTEVTREWLFASVCAHMYPEKAGPVKHLRAMGALELLLTGHFSRVYSQVFAKVILSGVHFAANLARMSRRWLT